MKGFFVVLEGGEGSGKTSILSAIAASMDVLATREPGGTPEGLALRSLLLSSAGDWEPEAELLLMVAARAQHVTRVILPALSAGRVVVCDRFLGSTLAYQGAGRGLSVAKIEALHRDFVGGLMPDLTMLLDVDPRIGLQRSRRRLGETATDEGRFEALDFAFHERVRADFLAQAAAHPSQTVTINAGPPLDRVVDEVVAILQERLT